MSESTLDFLIVFLMYAEFYIALATLVYLVARPDDHRLYPIPLWSTRRYAAVLILFWPFLLLAIPYLRHKNRHRTKKEVDDEIKARHLAAHKAMMRRYGIYY